MSGLNPLVMGLCFYHNHKKVNKAVKSLNPLVMGLCFYLLTRAAVGE